MGSDIKRGHAAGMTAVISISNMQSVLAQGTPTRTLKYHRLNATQPLNCTAALEQQQWCSGSLCAALVQRLLTVMDGKQA